MVPGRATAPQPGRGAAAGARIGGYLDLAGAELTGSMVTPGRHGRPAAPRQPERRRPDPPALAQGDAGLRARARRAARSGLPPGRRRGAGPAGRDGPHQRRHAEADVVERMWGVLRRSTVAFGHRPWLAVCWLVLFVVLGAAWFAVHPPQPIDTGERPVFNPWL